MESFKQWLEGRFSPSGVPHYSNMKRPIRPGVEPPPSDSSYDDIQHANIKKKWNDYYARRDRMTELQQIIATVQQTGDQQAAAAAQAELDDLQQKHDRYNQSLQNQTDRDKNRLVRLRQLQAEFKPKQETAASAGVPYVGQPADPGDEMSWQGTPGKGRLKSAKGEPIKRK